MAILQVDLSEYDALRKSLSDSEEKIKDLKSEIFGLKNKSRVILKTETPNLDYLKFRSQLKQLLSSYYVEVVIDSVKDCLKTNESEQFIGFDDIKCMVTEKLNNQYKEVLEKSKKKYDNYETYFKREKALIVSECSETIDDLKKENQEKIDALNKDIELMKEKISRLQREIANNEATIFNQSEKITALSKKRWWKF